MLGLPLFFEVTTEVHVISWRSLTQRTPSVCTPLIFLEGNITVMVVTCSVLSPQVLCFLPCGRSWFSKRISVPTTSSVFMCTSTDTVYTSRVTSESTPAIPTDCNRNPRLLLWLLRCHCSDSTVYCHGADIINMTWGRDPTPTHKHTVLTNTDGCLSVASPG